MRNPILALFTPVLLISTTPIAAQDLGLATVSPGDPRQAAPISGRCPTFNWSAVQGASTYELVVLKMSAIPMAGAFEDEQPILTASVHGAATGWTPSLSQCLEPDNRYAWAVRAVQDGKVSEWARPNLFYVASVPSRAELDEAMDVIRRYRESLDGAEREEIDTNDASSSRALDGETDRASNPRIPADGDRAKRVGEGGAEGNLVAVASPLHSGEPHFSVNGDGSAEANALTAFTATPSGGSEVNGTVVIGHPAATIDANPVNAGQLSFEEDINFEGLDCGFRFRHNGLTDTLTLAGGCAVFNTIATIDRNDLSTTFADVRFDEFNGAAFDGANGGNLVLSFQGNFIRTCNTICGNHRLTCAVAFDLATGYSGCATAASDLAHVLCTCTQ